MDRTKGDKRRRGIRLVLAIFFLCVAGGGRALGQAQQPKFRAKVRLVVSSNEDIKGLLTSYINRELRSLSDVDVVDQLLRQDTDVGYLYLISVVAMKVFTVGGANPGVALSFVIKRPFENRIILEKLVYPQVRDPILSVTDGLYYAGEHWLLAGPTHSLQDLCKQFVADFDAKVLEKDRQDFQLLLNRGMLKK